MKMALVCGAGGFIGSHLVKRLKQDGYWVRGVDLKEPEFDKSPADSFVIGDLRDQAMVKRIFYSAQYDEVYQLAADMGGAGYIFTGEHDADVMHNSATINLNVAHAAAKADKKPRIFYSSSACIYPAYNQEDPDNPKCSEESAYPAAPDSEYGWEKLFSERMYLAFQRNYKLDVRVARFHNIFGPYGTWKGGKEKAPAAMCRKAAETPNGGSIEVWGSGNQTRSFLYIDDCINLVLKFMHQDKFYGPVNIGSEEKVSINELAQMAIDISGKDIKINNIDGQDFYTKYGHKCPVGVNGRNSDNKIYSEKIGSYLHKPLIEGMQKTYEWISQQVAQLANTNK